MTSHLSKVEHLLSASTGVIVRGCRWSGKTHLASQLALCLPDCCRLGPSGWVRGSVDLEDRDLIARESKRFMRALMASPPRHLVVDDAEILLSFADPDFVERWVVPAIGAGVKLVWIRNRLVDEESGALAQAEVALRASLPIFELGHLPVSDARSFGGLSALMQRLRPYCPPSPNLDAFVRTTVRSFDLTHPVRTAILRAALGGYLPPLSLLRDDVRDHAGFLFAVGFLSPDVGGTMAVDKAVFWRRCAELATLREQPRPEEHTEVACRLEERLQRSGLATQVVEYLGVGADLADSWDRALMFASAEPGVARPGDEVLAELVGRAGLVRALRASGLPFPSNSPTRSLAHRLLQDGAA
jgi:hypothetical protein